MASKIHFQQSGYKLHIKLPTLIVPKMQADYQPYHCYHHLNPELEEKIPPKHVLKFHSLKIRDSEAEEWEPINPNSGSDIHKIHPKQYPNQ